MKIDLTRLVTESRNPASEQIDTLPTLDMLKVINQQDQLVALAVAQTLPQVAQAVEAIATAFAQGGRLIYMGAGTSGRLGILDASECPPTYGSQPEQVIGLIAGGHPAILKADENAEDNRELGQSDHKALHLSEKDVLVGIAASGRTPYVIAGMEYARAVGAPVVSLAGNPGCPMEAYADIVITPVVGAEVVTGSSRMKAGTAQKLVLNMLTTGAMIKSGKVVGNLMVDVEATNAKLIQRQTNIVGEATGVSAEQAEAALAACGRPCKPAILMILGGFSAEQAAQKLTQHQGFIRAALNQE